jgi:hypothetical protein
MATWFERFDELLDEAALSNPVFLTVREKQDAMRGWTRLIARAQAELIRVLAVADDVADETGARSTGHWLAHETRDHVGTTLMQERVAVAVGERWTRVGAAMAGGSVNLAQARVITEALDALPEDLDPVVRDMGEAYLVTEAAHFGPRELKRLGAKLLEVIAPDVADEAEYQRLLAEERRARSATRLTFKDRGDGSGDLHLRAPMPVINRVRTYVEAYTSPRRHPLGDVDDLPMARRRGEAFCALLEHLPAKGLPKHGGTATSVMVMVDLDTLRHETGLAETSTGDRLTAGQVRRLACQADIVPVVLNGRSEVLDLGRARRLFSPAQRKAMAIRDRECTAQGCSIPAAWCEAHHHKQPWSQGGKTDLADGKLLCSFHHHRAHDPGWETHHPANGSTTFHRRT